MTKIFPLLMAALFFMTGYSNSAAAEAISTNKSVSDGQGNGKNSIVLTLKATYKGFQAPTGIAADKDGNLYVSNWSGGTVTKVDTKGNHSVFADSMGSPAGLAFDKAGRLYISDYSEDVIYRVTPDGKKSIFARGFHTPTGIAFSHSGELLVTNRGSNEIVKVDASGKVKPAAGGMRTPVGVAEDSDGNLYVTNYGGGIIKVASDGTTSTVSDEFGRPGVGIGINDQKIIFAADNGDGCVRTLAADGTTEIAVDNIGGCVAVLVHANTLYVGSWNDGAVYAYTIETK